MKKYRKNEENIDMINIKKAKKKLSNKIYRNRWKYLTYLLLIVLFVEIIIIIKYILIKKNKKSLNNNLERILKNNELIINNTIQDIKNNSKYQLISQDSINIEINNNNSEHKNIANIINLTITDNINNNSRLNDMIISDEEIKYDSLYNAAERAKDFINKSFEGILFNSSFLLSNNPIITVVIPLYNCEKTIKRAIRSIQNQNISDFEIILVNDLSTDNSSIIIEHLQKEDQRIKIINNKKNMGTLYTRCIGTLSAKGKYIFPLDNDDMFLDKDVFYKIAIKTAEKYDFDIVEFRGIESKGTKNFFKNNFWGTMFNRHKKGRILYQPELASYPLRPAKELSHYHMSDAYIWAKCIKTDIYQNAIKLYGEKRYSNFVTTFEDLIINFIIFQIAKSFNFIPKYGILRLFYGSSAYLHTSQIAFNKYEMRLLDAVVDFSRNTFEGKQIVVNVAVKFLKNNALGETLKKEKYKILLKSILERIYKCEYISEEHKQIIKEKSSKFNLF